MQVERLIGHHEAYEDHAADFMDDLFSEVEQSLRLHRSRRTDPQPARVAPVIEPEETIVSLVKVDVDAISLPIVPEIAPTWMEPLREATIPASVVPEQSSGFDKFLLGTAVASVLIGASVVLAHYALVQRSLMANGSSTPASVETTASDRENYVFSSEIKTALSTATAAPQITVSPVVPPNPPTTAQPQTIVQYVPLFSPPPVAPPTYSDSQPTSTFPAPVYTNPPEPQEPVAIAPTAAVSEPPAPSSSSGGSYERSTPASVTSTAPQITVAPSPSIVATKPSTPRVIEPEVPPLTGSKTGSTLSGLFMLEPNDRSYALVESNGSVQSIPIGGAVGGSGWKLKKVTQQSAVLERNGVSRSVSVGQKF